MKASAARARRNRHLTVQERIARGKDARVAAPRSSHRSWEPAANVRGWRRLFPRGRLIVVPGAGHGTLEYECVQKLIARFVEHADAARLDASCVRHVPLSPFITG